MRPVPAVPRATMRLQLGPGFGFDAARRVVPYASALGISHLFVSPILAAMPGSTHGYDVVDHDRVAPELGGEAGLRQLVAALRRQGMGLIVDVVPNHMAAGGDANRRWQSLLAWGTAAAEADFFALDPRARGRPLRLPCLAGTLEQALASGALRLDFDADQGALFLEHHGQRCALAAHSYAPLLASAGLDELAAQFALEGGGHAPAPRARHGSDDPRHAFAAAQAALAAAGGRAHARLRRALAGHHDGSTAAAARLRALLDAQHYRLTGWRQATTAIDYRRFFDINGLIALRGERPAVFDATHATLLRLYAEGLIDGLRIDHIDGLADPRGYCRRLRAQLAQRRHLRPPHAPAGPAWIVVEKILAEHEWLRADWPVDGSTGYEFMEAVSALLHDGSGAAELDRLWRLCGGRRYFNDEVRAARRQIVDALLAADVDRVTAALHAVARRRGEKVEVDALRAALVALLVALPAYRDYGDASGRDEADARMMAAALARASARAGATTRHWLTEIDRWLGGEPETGIADRSERRLRRTARIAFQQLTPPVAAKAVEDTAFYRYGRLLSRNEVGGTPARLAIGVAEFHRRNGLRRARHPRGMLATASHDHKRGEDLRMRLAVLSEQPALWRGTVARWRLANLAARRHIDVPDCTDEVMLYQMMAGAWPPALDSDNHAGLVDFSARLRRWQRKAIREARRHGSWHAPGDAYEAACDGFIHALLETPRGAAFRLSMRAIVDRIAAPGAVKGLSQTLLRLTSPGVPELYQGTEFWDFSLVDPDNRQPVDFQRRRATLRQAATDRDCLRHWRDGRVKQRLIARGLRLRAAAPALFRDGDYLPLRLRGARGADWVAYARHHRRQALIVIAPWRLRRLLEGGDALTPDAAALTDLRLLLPAALRGRRWTSWLGAAAPAAPGADSAADGGADMIDIDSGGLRLAPLLAYWPLVLLASGIPATTGPSAGR